MIATLPEEIAAIQWPDPQQVFVATRNRRQGYETPIGFYPRVTSVLKVLGLGTENLIGWAAKEERKAALEAVEAVVSAGLLERLPWPEVASDPKAWGPAALQLVSLVEDALGPARAHQKIIAKAGDIGTSVHEAIRHRLRVELGMPVGAEPELVEQAQWAFMAWEDWWKASGYIPVRSEQPIYDAELQYAGTIDLIAWHPEKGLGIEDFKTGKYIYDEAHLQVVSYIKAARNWAPMLQWGEILRLPKNVDDPAFEVRTLGELHERTLTQGQLLTAFTSALTAWKLLLAKGE